jgi:hypothetical protein
MPLVPAAPIGKGELLAPLLYRPARWCSVLGSKSSCCGVKEPADRAGQRITEHIPTAPRQSIEND